MLQSQLFGKTQKETPSDVSVESHKLLYRAGFIRESVAGRYYFLPLGMRVQDKIMKIIEEEMVKAGAQKILTPTLHQLDLWKETKRTKTAGFELMIVKDRRDMEFALGGTAEEMIVDVVRKFNISYKDLPFNIFQFSNKFRDELRSRGGLLRTREFIMKDAYSFHSDEEDFKKEYKKMWQVYLDVFKKMDLEAFAIESDNGYIAGDYCHEFIVKSDIGESKAFISKDGKYAAHEDVAKFKRELKNIEEKEKEMIEVAAQRENTMNAGVEFHKFPLWQQIKNVMMVNENDEMILAVLRGDLDLNETKLKKIINAIELRKATDEEIRQAGSEPGFISPIGINRQKVKVVGDISLKTIKNGYTGANKKYRDLLNVNYERDFRVDIEGDIALIQNDFMSEDGEKLEEIKGIEVGNIFQLGCHYSKLMNATFVNKKGEKDFYYMGCYGIGIGRTLATIAEIYHDEKGMIWPESVAPYSFHLIGLNDKEGQVKKVVQEFYEDLLKKGVDVLYDDRDLSAGEKFADADLIGIPTRIVLSARTLKEQSIEIKKRKEDKSEIKTIESFLAGL